MSSNSKLYDKIVLTSPNNLPFVAPKVYRGFSTVSNQTENFGLFDFQLIQQDILNHFHIRQGERLMNPSFGTVIWDLIFEPLTDEVRKLITSNVDRILNSEPRVRTSQVIITPYETGLQIECVLTYLPYNISQEMKLRFDQTNGLLIG